MRKKTYTTTEDTPITVREPAVAYGRMVTEKNFVNPIIIYPPDATRAKFISEAAEYSGAKVMKFTKRHAELIDDILFGQAIEDGLKTPEVSEEQIFKTLRNAGKIPSKI